MYGPVTEADQIPVIALGDEQPGRQGPAVGRLDLGDRTICGSGDRVDSARHDDREIQARQEIGFLRTDIARWIEHPPGFLH